MIFGFYVNESTKGGNYTISIEAYYNRGLTKIFINQKDSGCLDLSKAGELGVLSH